MELVFSILIIITGFSLISYLHKEHLLKLEELLKAKDYTEYKVFEKAKREFVPLEDESDELQDRIHDKKPNEIRDMFKSTPING